MRITKIKLAGFKSFVDPTTLYLPGNLTGVVGPNGCGKSNIIDAMIWVMGESSAKHLRGDSMADVIFSGSGSRKPVGQASVELIFDNADGALGGAYAGFAEISIKRTVTRDGVSSYFLNGARCRRKDIIDVFLGTGLGARGGYSVIEQGMISRVIEAKPDELRGFLEEAAGISRYKERRRETENRIRHTEDNLARVNDVREELDRQLGHLQRQARAAERYQELKAEERRLEAELIALRWKKLEDARQHQAQLILERETAVEAAQAELRAIEARQTALRTTQTEAQEGFNARQADFYARSAEVSRLEQSLQHNEDRRRSVEQDLQRARASLEETGRLHAEDEARFRHVSADIDALQPEEQQRAAHEEQTVDALRAVEDAAETWQREWDDYQREHAEAARQEHAEQVRLELTEAGFTQAQQRAQALAEEQALLGGQDLDGRLRMLEEELATRERHYDALIGEQQQVRSELQAVRLALDEQTAGLHQRRSDLQRLLGQESSLAALQAAALGRDGTAVQGWLDTHGLRESDLLAGQLHIESGWELAVEMALRLPLSTVCEPAAVTRLAGIRVDDLPLARLAGLEREASVPSSPGRAGLPTPLQAKVRSGWPLDTVLAGVYACDSLEQALALRTQLLAHESLVTREGIWLGPNWIQLPGRENVETGVLARQRALEELHARLEELRRTVAHAEQDIEALQAARGRAEIREGELALALQEAFAASNETKAGIALIQGERMRLEARLRAITTELTGLGVEAEQGLSTLSGLREQISGLRLRLESLATRGETLNTERREVQARLETARTAWRAARESRHEVALKLEGLRSTRHSLEQALARNARLVEELKGRCTDLETVLAQAAAPQQALGERLQEALSERQTLEHVLKAAREALEACETSLREAEERQLVAGREIANRQQGLESVRLEERALQVRAQELVDRLEQQTQKLPEVLANTPEDANEEGWRERLEGVANRLNRLGPINLAAIDEFAQLSERKTYLDAQCEDLTQALATLQDAMQKIDRETRTRFRETFDRVNQGMQRLFPLLFGGGHAQLEMTEEDLLETGVTVMARPPGKRNSTIHLLSGGEKALTALSFVFSLFELNPAPFCLLDEVDAPLDDTNVVRLTELLKSMADRVQFLFVTHNKITMEIAEQLIGVTMHEPGVSRLVSVNMEEAVALAQSA